MAASWRLKPFSGLESMYIYHVLRNLSNEISILQRTLIPKRVDYCEIEREVLQLSEVEKNVFKWREVADYLLKILNDTCDELSRNGTYGTLTIAIKNLKAPFEEYKNLEREEKYLMNKLDDTKRELKLVKAELIDEKNTILNTAFRVNLEEEMKNQENKARNSLNYIKKYLDSRESSTQKYFEKQIEDKLKEIKDVAIKTEWESRCSDDMQCFLRICRENLLSEIEENLKLQDKLLAEYDNRMQMLRIDREVMTEDIEMMEKLFEQRTQQIEDAKIWRETRNEKLPAIITMQTWWRAYCEGEGAAFFKKIEESRWKKLRKKKKKKATKKR